MSMSIVINTPTSHIGSKLAARLLDAGEKVTITSRAARARRRLRANPAEERKQCVVELLRPL